jgi:outer membrane protein TolC
MAAFLAGALVAGPAAPAFAQSQNQASPPADSQGTPSAPTPNVSLGLSKHDFSRGPRVFPRFWDPYSSIFIEHPDLTNSPTLEQLIHDNKLEISLQQAVELALENNLDILVQRYNPWLSETDLLRSKAGSGIRGAGGTTSTINTTGASTQGLSTPTTGAGITNTSSTFSTGAGAGFALGSSPAVSFDPLITSSVSIDDQAYPVNNPFLSGVGTGSSIFALGEHTSQFNVAYQQGFWPGTTVQVSFNNTRSSATTAYDLFNPSVQSTLGITVQQQLLSGFGRLPNTKNIMIAKNNKKVADLQFQLQVITTVTSTVTAYWELVYARANVGVQQQAVTVSEKLYNDNKKQLEIGTMAPLDVTRAESELATDRQNLILAQTTQLQQEQILKATIAKNPLDPRLMNVEIIPTDQPARPQVQEAATFQEAVQEAFAHRPDLRQQEINLDTQKINVKATRNALLPIATLSATYSGNGLAGNEILYGPSSTVGGVPIVNAAGVPVQVFDPTTNTYIPIFYPVSVSSTVGVQASGLGTAVNQIFHNTFPNYSAQINLQIPLRNRSAQADNQEAILQQRQGEATYQQVKNSALLDVRNTYIALQQDRARVEAAIKARELQQQTFEAEQKKYNLGASTVYQVILTQRDFVTAQGTELRALVDLVEAKANYERAIGRTLDINNINVAGNNYYRDTLIPGDLAKKTTSASVPSPVEPQGK